MSRSHVDSRPMDWYLQSALEEISEAAGSLDEGAISRCAAGQWSAGEILEHLTLAFSVCSAGLEKALALGQPRAGRPSVVQRLARMLVLDLGYFPRATAPETTRPHGTIAGTDALPAIRAALAHLDDALTRASARFGDDVPVINHPYFGGMSVRQWRKFHWRHAVHHMRQVRARMRAARGTGQA